MLQATIGKRIGKRKGIIHGADVRDISNYLTQIQGAHKLDRQLTHEDFIVQTVDQNGNPLAGSVGVLDRSVSTFFFVDKFSPQPIRLAQEALVRVNGFFDDIRAKIQAYDEKQYCNPYFWE